MNDLQPVRMPVGELGHPQGNRKDFLEHWKEFLPMYIGNGRPSKDTIINYTSSIDQFIDWTLARQRHPLDADDYSMRLYLKWLYDKEYKKDSVALKIAAVRSFFTAARMLGVIFDNPVKNIVVPQSGAEERIYFFTPDQLYEIESMINKEENEFRRLRNLSAFYLMGVEGLRNVEIHRMHQEDIDWTQGSILVRGKGKNRTIFPCGDTLERIDKYLQVVPDEELIKKEKGLTPLFLSDSNFNQWGRISRNGLRYIMNGILEGAGYKKPGVSCHVFRHSTGTNLYAATKDLRLVQDQLGHAKPETTARYAHLQERMTKRRTSAIVPHPKVEDNNHEGGSTNDLPRMPEQGHT